MNGNVVVSPVSVATLLSILQQGSGGNTEAQLTEVLNLKTQQSRQGYSKLTRNLKVKQWREKMANFFTQLKEVDLGWLFYFISGLLKDADSSWGYNDLWGIFCRGATAPSGSGPPDSRGFTITLTDTNTPHSTGLLWLSDQPEAGTSTWQHTKFVR